MSIRDMSDYFFAWSGRAAGVQGKEKDVQEGERKEKGEGLRSV